MNRQNAFGPSWGKGVILATSTSTGNTEVGINAFNVVITNQDGTDGMYVACGDSTVTATTADYYLPPNGQVCITKKKEYTHVAAIAVANTPSIHIIPGQGV
jgi:hypothetical protein